MIEYVFVPPPIPSVEIAGSDQRFPVHRIYCVGRNYADHVREMGSDVKEPPVFFTKPADAIVASGVAVPYPPRTENFHYEVELVIAVGGAGRNIPAAQALDHVFGYAVGNDLTRRDLQGAAKKTGRPWDFGKAFAQSAPISEIHRAADIGHPSNGSIWLDVNGKRRQTGDLKDLIWDVPNTLSFLSQYYDLMPGDLIYTGTPAGVAAVVAGDTLHGHVDGLSDLRITVSQPV